MRQVTDIFPMKASTDQDERQKLYLLPEAIKLTRGNVADAELLLKDQQAQAFLGKRAACRLENGADGEMAAILLDFGRELHGNLRLTVTDVKSASRRVRVRVRFGESVMEALTPLYEKNAGNDHAVRDHLYDIGMLSTTAKNNPSLRSSGSSSFRNCGNSKCGAMGIYPASTAYRLYRFAASTFFSVSPAKGEQM